MPAWLSGATDLVNVQVTVRSYVPFAVFDGCNASNVHDTVTDASADRSLFGPFNVAVFGYVSVSTPLV